MGTEVGRRGDTAARRKVMREEKMEQARGTREARRRDGMRTMDMALCELYETGKVEYEDVLKYLLNARAIPVPGSEGLGHPSGGYRGKGQRR